jgi:catechol 2,3-dioxygenase-like lactoylglutathione lyase family enzyme
LLWVAGWAAIASVPSAAGQPFAIGLDHIPVAVSDLERAATTYAGLGFSLKPGRDHANGIRNQHVKFRDGAGIELLTAPRGVDALSTHYVDHLAAGEGPAFVSFHARDTGRLHAALRGGGFGFQQDRVLTTLTAPELAFEHHRPGSYSPVVARASGHS